MILKEKLHKYSTVSIFVTFIAVNNICILTFSLGTGYYICMAFALLYLLSKTPITKSNSIMLAFLFICCASILINDIPEYFNPWGRLGSFILNTSLLSPLLISTQLNTFRIQAFRLIFYFIQPLIWGSIIAYIFNLSFTTAWVGFCGVTTHSMILAPVAALGLIFSLYFILWKRKDNGQIWTIYYIILGCSAFILLFVAQSRTTVIATGAGILAMLFIKGNANIIRMAKYLIGFVVLLATTYPYWAKHTEGIQHKTEASINEGSIYASREDHWATRIAEFKSSPTFGIGFCAVDTQNKISTFDETDGKVESGSSWLCALSMTGLAGFLTIITLFIQAINRCFQIRKISQSYAGLLLSSLIFWIFHMIAEGYIFAAGGFAFFNVWLLLGTIQAVYLCKNNYA